jgi:hypothetical protein
MICAACPMNWDRRGACFDKLSMRFFLNAMKILPHPEPVEGPTAFVQQPHIRLPFSDSATAAIQGIVLVIVILFASTLERHGRASIRRHIRNFNPGSQVSPEIRAVRHSHGSTAMEAGA